MVEKNLRGREQKRELHRNYSVVRRFASPRRGKDLVRDLLRAHSGGG